MVQFASSNTDQNQYALKFFLSAQDFVAEKKIYTESPLGDLLPRHEGLYDNSDSILMDAKGNKLPPCIVMERGESLDEWSRRRKPDMWAAMPVRITLLMCPPLIALVLLVGVNGGSQSVVDIIIRLG